MHTNTAAAQQMTAAALSTLFATSGRTAPADFDVEILTRTAETLSDDDRLVFHIVEGSATPGTARHRGPVFELAEKVGPRRTLAAVVAACQSTTFATPGNLGRMLLAGAAGTIDDIMTVFTPDTDVRTVDGIVDAWPAPVRLTDLLTIAERCNLDACWVAARCTSKQRPVSKVTDDELSTFVTFAAATDPFELARVCGWYDGWLTADQLYELLAAGDPTSVALASTGMSRNLFVFERIVDVLIRAVADADRLAVTLVAQQFRSFEATWATAHEELLLRTVAEQVFTGRVAVVDVGCTNTFLRVLVDVAPELATRWFETAAATDVVDMLVAADWWYDYQRRFVVRTDVYRALVTNGTVTAAKMVGANTFFERQPHLSAALSDIPGLLPAFVEFCADKRNDVNAARHVFAAVDDVFAASATAEVPDAHIRLWETVVMQRPGSPALDTERTVLEVRDIYLDRWTQAAQRTGRTSR